ncbi:MAG: hypothetical protein ACTSR8_06205 [Promethearchaeota archaeon]
MPSNIYAITVYDTPSGFPKVIYGRIDDLYLEDCDTSFILVETSIQRNGKWTKVKMSFHKEDVRIVVLKPKSSIFFDEDTHLAIETKI